MNTPKRAPALGGQPRARQEAVHTRGQLQSIGVNARPSTRATPPVRSTVDDCALLGRVGQGLAPSLAGLFWRHAPKVRQPRDLVVLARQAALIEARAQFTHPREAAALLHLAEVIQAYRAEAARFAARVLADRQDTGGGNSYRQ